MIRFRSAERSRRHVLVSAAVIAAGGAIAVAVVLPRQGGGADATRRELEAEFSGAYPAQPRGGGDFVEIELVAEPSTVTLLDGDGTEVWAYNGSVPGPPIRATLGDTLRINVRNGLPAATTIHWHGIRVPNDMDGVPDVNQPRIEPGGTFVYEFTPPDAGTYWYHSHTDGSQQLERGLYGSLVIEDPDDGTSYDHDQVWVMDDWRLTEEGQIDPHFDTTADRTQNGRWGDLITVNSSTSSQLTVAPGERVRLRLINASNGRVYAPDFGELEATVIGVDGLTVGRAPALGGLALAPGNRLDVDIVAPSTPGSYPVSDTFTGTAHPLASIVVGDPPTASDPVVFDPPTNADVPEWDNALDAPIDHDLVLETHNVGDEWIWTINGTAYPDHQPLRLTEGEFTKIRIVNQTHPLHPMHLHGQFFKVLTRNGQAVNEPYFRDTVLLDRLDEVEIALVPLDVGDWVLHCHIQEHADAGMMTVMEIADDASGSADSTAT